VGGVIPISQTRDLIPPVSLVTDRVPSPVFKAVYGSGLQISIAGREEERLIKLIKLIKLIDFIDFIYLELG